MVKSKCFDPTNHLSFGDYFINKTPGTIISFLNKSKDTQLITLAPVNDIYKSLSDIMSFMRGAYSSLKHDLLKNIGREMLKTNNIYLSTHGHGVPYLHIRMCKSAKYYVM